MTAALRRAGKVPVKHAAAPGIIVPRIQAYRDETLTRLVGLLQNLKLMTKPE